MGRQGVTVDRNASRNQIISELCQKVNEKPAFAKKLFSMPGMSGVFLSLACTHGVVYGVKALMKHESPSDYADLVLSLLNPPCVLICDMPDRVATSISRANKDTLASHNGMLSEPTEENIKQAKKNQLKVHLPFLKTKQKITWIHDHQMVPNDLHPIAGTNKCTYFMMTFISKIQRVRDHEAH